MTNLALVPPDDSKSEETLRASPHEEGNSEQSKLVVTFFAHSHYLQDRCVSSSVCLRVCVSPKILQITSRLLVL